MPRHTHNVSTAIQEAVHNIHLLKKLVDAPDATSVDRILRADPPNIKLTNEELNEFWTSLKTGLMTIDAKALVDFCEQLASGVTKGKPPQNEWNP
jgi:hypothetical protein